MPNIGSFSNLRGATRQNEDEIARIRRRMLHMRSKAEVPIQMVGGCQVQIDALTEQINALTAAVAVRSAIGHTHEISDIVGLAASLAAKASTIHSHAINDITGLSSALSGLSDAIALKAPLPHTHALADVTGLVAALAAKAAAVHSHPFTDLTGVMSKAQLPAGYPQRIESYNGVTNASGLHTVTFPNPFTLLQSVQPVLVGTDTETQFRIVSRSALSFSVHVFKRQTTTLLGIVVLQQTTVNVVGAQVDVLVTGS